MLSRLSFNVCERFPYGVGNTETFVNECRVATHNIFVNTRADERRVGWMTLRGMLQCKGVRVPPLSAV
jgi:hypothetical protein